MWYNKYMEILDLYDSNNQKLNKTIVRGDKNLLPNEHIKLVTVWLKCGEKYLIQKCSEQKGSEFAVTGGHVQAGKSSREQAVLELEEELGLKVNIDDLKLLGSIVEQYAIYDVYLLEKDDLCNSKFTLQEEEVESVNWLSLSQIQSLIDQNNFRKSSKKQFEMFIK